MDIALREYRIDSKTKDVVIGEEGNERGRQEENDCHHSEYSNCQFRHDFRSL